MGNSIIAEILVLPWSSLGRPELSELPELLRSAVSKNAAELCALSTGPMEGCNIELKDLGFARPSVARYECTAVPPYSCPGQPTQQQHADGNGVSNHTVQSQLVGASMEKGHSLKRRSLWSVTSTAPWTIIRYTLNWLELRWRNATLWKRRSLL